MSRASDPPVLALPELVASLLVAESEFEYLRTVRAQLCSGLSLALPVAALVPPRAFGQLGRPASLGGLFAAVRRDINKTTTGNL